MTREAQSPASLPYGGVLEDFLQGNYLDRFARLRRRCEGRPDDQGFSLGHGSLHGTVLTRESGCRERAVLVPGKPGTQIVLAAVVRLQCLAKSGGHCLLVAFAAAKAAQDGAQEHERANKGGDGVAGKPEERRSAQLPEEQGLAGTHRDLPEVEFQPLFSQYRADQIVLASRGAPGRDQEICSLRAGGE